jgi:hypothetical protein
MKEKRRTPRSLYAILAVLAALAAYFFISRRPFEHHRLGTCTAEVSGTSRTWTVEGTKDAVRKITLELRQARSEAAAEEQAMAMAGNEIALIKNSTAVQVTFFEEDENTLCVTMTIDPSELEASDYTYFNANNLVVLGTINWQESGVTEVLAAIQLDGTGAVCTFAP